MAKKVIFVLFGILFVFNKNVVSQFTFTNTISLPEDQMIKNIEEGEDGSFLLVGKIHNLETNFPAGYLIKIDSLGNLIQENAITYSDTNTHIFYNVHFFDGDFFILGSRQFIYPYYFKLWYLRMDSDLNIISEKFINLQDNKWFSYMNSIIDSDTNFVITGYTTRPDSTDPSPSPYNEDPYFIKLSLDGDSIVSNFITNTYHVSHSYDIIEKTDNTGYIAYGFKYSEYITGGGQRFELDNYFDSLNIEDVPYNISSYTSATKLTDSTIIVSGGGGSYPAPSYSISVLSTTTDNTPIDYNFFMMNGNIRDYTAFYDGVSKHGDHIYVGGTSNFDYANPFWSTNDSWFHLVKINPDLSPIWEYWYGGDAYYQLYSILATNDGGCIMVGNRYDYETQNQERDIYIVKVDSNGLITWTQEIPITKTKAVVFPNPGTDQLNIKSSINCTDLELINLNGQVVIRQNLDKNQSAINTESLKPGMYFYRLIDFKSKTIETGKWIKE